MLGNCRCLQNLASLWSLPLFSSFANSAVPYTYICMYMINCVLVVWGVHLLREAPN